MADKVVFVPLTDLSFTSGKLNSTGLVQADGALHNGAGFLAPPPLFLPANDLSDLDDSITDPIFAHANLSPANSATFCLYLYAGGKILKCDVSGAPPWTFSVAKTLGTALVPGEGNLVSFGPHEIMAAGLVNPVQLRRNGQANFEDCFTSEDKPRFKFAATIAQRLLFAHAANVGTAAPPEPNPNLLWWGFTNDARQIGNEEDLPTGLTGFQSMDDELGDITGLLGGRLSATIFKSGGIYVMDLGGDVTGFSFERASAAIGCKEPRSMIGLNEDAYFVSTVGPAAVRSGRLVLLGDGFWTLRGMLQECPTNPELKVLSAAVDRDNGIVMWLLQMKSLAYTYIPGEVPRETEGASATMYALLAYNALSNQFSFLWRERSADGITLVDEGSPTAAHSFRPLCLIDRVPWNNYLQLNGLGLFCVESAATQPTPPRLPKLFLSGLSGSSFTPDWTFGQKTILTTGLMPLAGQRYSMVKGVQPVFRSRRGKLTPQASIGIRTCNAPWELERLHGPFVRTTNQDRRGFIRTNMTTESALTAIDVTIDQRYDFGAEVGKAYTYLMNELEGVLVEFSDGAGK